jgi:putative transcriptional regulator
MNQKEFESIKKGLKEAVKHAKGKGRIARIHKPKPINVKLVRKKTGMTQVQFAALFGFGLGTLRHWERGDRKPNGPSLVLLNVIAKDPKSVLKALEEDTEC